MNFVLHHHLAARDLDAPLGAIGAMLPDLFGMADRKVKPRADAAALARAPGLEDDTRALLRGVAHHLEADLWFHAADVFRAGEARLARELVAAAPEAPRLVLFAHVAWELCLDGALLRRTGVEAPVRAFREGFARARQGPVEEVAGRLYFERADRAPADARAFHAALARIFDALGAGPGWIAGYCDGGGIAARLEGVRARFGFPALTRAEREAVARALDEGVARADGSLDSVLAARFSGAADPST